MYREAAELWPVQAPVVAFSLARALAESGRCVTWKRAGPLVVLLQKQGGVKAVFA